MGEAWATWGGWIIAFIASVVAIKGTVHFDVNEWLKERRNQKEKYLRSLCPHVQLGTEDGRPIIKPTHISPPGASGWQCQLCGDVSHDVEALRGYVAYWKRNPAELSERHEKMKKIARKLGRQ